MQINTKSYFEENIMFYIYTTTKRQVYSVETKMFEVLIIKKRSAAPPKGAWSNKK